MKNLIEKLEEIKNSPRGGAIFFFAFYFLFFVFVFALLGIGHNNSNTSKKYEGNKSTNYNGMSNKNYDFIYKINLDGIEYNYIGKQNNDKSLFEFNGNNYYVAGDKYFIYDGSNLNSVNSPYIVDEIFVDSDKISELIKLASFESKTEYESGKKNYNYLISSNTINKYFYNIDSDYLENPNRLVVIANENNIVDNVVLYLDSFCVLNKTCQNSLRIELSYSNFGKIEEINNPIG